MAFLVSTKVKFSPGRKQVEKKNLLQSQGVSKSSFSTLHLTPHLRRNY